MARQKGKRRGGRVTPRGTRPAGRRHDRPLPAEDGPDLLREVRDRLATGEPLDLLAEVSSLVAAVDPRSRSPFDRSPLGRRSRSRDAEVPSLEELVRSFGEVERPETTAMLACLAVLAPDELVRARARRHVAGRPHRLPAWLAGIGVATAGRRAVEMTHVLGDGDDLVVEVLLRGERGPHALSIVVYVDHNQGTVAKDAFVVPGPLDELVTIMKEHDEAPGDTTFHDIGPADAKARIVSAVEDGAHVHPPFESETWPACRPIVEWAARLLPDGGRGYVRPEWDEASKAELTEAFFASPYAARLGPGHRRLFESILWFATDYGPGDPLRGSPTAVEILLTDWIPRKVVAPGAFLAKVPEVLRAFVANAHAERGVPSHLRVETQQAVDEFEPEYQQTIRSPRPQGPWALLAGMAALDPDLLPGAIGLTEPYDADALLVDRLRRSVGGRRPWTPSTTGRSPTRGSTGTRSRGT